MSKHKPGIRVIAIHSSDRHTVYIYGYGTYVGDEEPPVGPFGSTWEEFDKLALEAFGQEEFDRRKAAGELRPKNPKVELDNGKIVWGQECWWCPEEQADKFVGARRVEEVAHP